MGAVLDDRSILDVDLVVVTTEIKGLDDAHGEKRLLTGVLSEDLSEVRKDEVTGSR